MDLNTEVLVLLAAMGLLVVAVVLLAGAVITAEARIHALEAGAPAQKPEARHE